MLRAAGRHTQTSFRHYANGATIAQGCANGHMRQRIRQANTAKEGEVNGYAGQARLHNGENILMAAGRWR